MANLGQKNSIYHARFRYQGIQYKKSLRTRDPDNAQGALKSIEQTIHLLTMGHLQVPAGIDPGGFIVNGGKVPAAHKRTRAEGIPRLPALRDMYLQSLEGRLADSYIDSQRTHLQHLEGFLNGSARQSIEKVVYGHLDRFIQTRLKVRNAGTVAKERNTLLHFFRWCVKQGFIKQSPAEALDPIPHGDEMDRFRTTTEIKKIVERGGITDEQTRKIWECLYLATTEIGELLELVRKRAMHDTAYLLHAIPAYTGMRRGEVLRLRWTDLDVQSRIITAHSRKQSRSQEFTARDIDLHEDLCRELVDWREQRPKGQFVICHADTLFPITKDQANRYFWQPMRRTEWCLNGTRNWFKVGFHTYRHSFSSNLASVGVDERIIDKFMGHQTEAMRRRYRHLFPGDRRSAIESLSFTGSNSEQN